MKKLKKEIALFSTSVKAGFPSPADDFVENKLDLNEFIIKNEPATFFVKVSGESMLEAGIFSGDILVVDKSIEPLNNSIVIAIVDNEFTVKRFIKEGSKVYLKADNSKFTKIFTNFEIWGVVTFVIKKV